MANLQSSKKDIRRIKRRTARNETLKDRIKRNEKAVLSKIASGDIEGAKKSIPNLQKVLDKAVKVNYIKKGTADRKKSRIMKKLNTSKS